MPDQTLTGRVLRLMFQDAAKGFAIFEIETPEQTRVTVTAMVPEIAEGLDVRVTGDWRDHPRFGRQFRANTIVALPPERAEGIAAFLQSGKVEGIGPKLAARLVGHFGDATREALDGDPARLTEVPGIGQAKAESIHRAWNSQKAWRDTFIVLSDLGLTPAQANRTGRIFGEEAPARVKAAPYDLARRVPGIGFKTADAIAERLGVARDAPMRMEAAVRYVLAEASEAGGHLFLPLDGLLDAVREVTGQDEAPARAAVDAGVLLGDLVLEARPEGTRAWDAGLHAAEGRVAKRLRLLADQVVPPVPVEGVQAGDVTLAPSQMAALRKVAGTAVSVLTGGPGTGKTTVVAALLAAAQRAKLRVALAAPTGRAAVRMREATGHEAKTIHRLLEYNPRDGGFVRGDHLPLDCDWLVVDESSMLDVVLMDRLIRAVAPGTRLTFVGDADQLPPVGPGDPLRDLIRSESVPVARLGEVFRQGTGSAIVHNAHRILHGDEPIPAPRDAADLGDFYTVWRDDPLGVAEAVVTLVAERIPARFGLDPVRQIQVLAPMRRGDCGTDALNRALRARLNPVAGDGPGFARGDRVIQNRNNYDRDAFNGDIGVVTSVEPGGATAVRFDDRDVVFEPSDLDDLALAHAVTVHKSQGSEFPAVVVVLHTQHYVMLRRNLLYTAVTRGRRLVVLVGNKRALRLALDNARVEPRNTGLAERLRALS